MTGDSQELLMSQLLHSATDFVKALNAGLRREDLETEDLRDAWDVTVANHRQGRPHDIIAIWDCAPDHSTQQVILEFFTLIGEGATEFRSLEIPLSERLKKAFRRNFNV